MTDSPAKCAILTYDLMSTRQRLLTELLPEGWYLADIAPGEPGQVEVGTVARSGALALADEELPTTPSKVADPELFGGRHPPAVYVDILIKSTARAAALLRAAPGGELDDADVAFEVVGIHASLIAADALHDSLTWNASWLKHHSNNQVVERAPIAMPTPVPLYGDAHHELEAVTGSPTARSSTAAHRYQVASRLAHIHVRRLRPTWPLADESALLACVVSRASC